MKTTGLGLATGLITIGAILAWAVTYEVEGIDIQQMGLIMFVVGVVVGITTLVMAATGQRTTVTRENQSTVNGIPAVTVEKETVRKRDDSL